MPSRDVRVRWLGSTALLHNVMPLVTIIAFHTSHFKRVALMVAVLTTQKKKIFLNQTKKEIKKTRQKIGKDTNNTYHWQKINVQNM